MRKLVAIAIMLGFMALWIWAAATIGTRLTAWPGWAQLAFYGVAGIGWILPLRPVLAWMNSVEQPPDD